MYFGDFSKIKSFDDVVTLTKRFCLALALLFFCFFAWGKFVSPPLEYSELSELEGVVIEKWRSNPSRATEEYRLRVKTGDGIKQLRIASHLVAHCCFLEEIPLNRKVSMLTNWSVEGIKLYQLSYGNKVLLDAHEVLAAEEDKLINYLPFSLLLLLVGGLAYLVESTRKAGKNS